MTMLLTVAVKPDARLEYVDPDGRRVVGTGKELDAWRVPGTSGDALYLVNRGELHRIVSTHEQALLVVPSVLGFLSLGCPVDVEIEV